MFSLSLLGKAASAYLLPPQRKRRDFIRVRVTLRFGHDSHPVEPPRDHPCFSGLVHVRVERAGASLLDAGTATPSDDVDLVLVDALGRPSEIPTGSPIESRDWLRSVASACAAAHGAVDYEGNGGAGTSADAATAPPPLRVLDPCEGEWVPLTSRSDFARAVLAACGTGPKPAVHIMLVPAPGSRGSEFTTATAATTPRSNTVSVGVETQVPKGRSHVANDDEQHETSTAVGSPASSSRRSSGRRSGRKHGASHRKEAGNHPGGPRGKRAHPPRVRAGADVMATLTTPPPPPGVSPRELQESMDASLRVSAAVASHVGGRRLVPRGYAAHVSDFARFLELDYSRLLGGTSGRHHYLDHCGAALYPESLVSGNAERLRRSILGNPHTIGSPSGALSSAHIKALREELLRFAHTDASQYAVVLTANATAACELVASSFPWSSGSRVYIATSNHTSVLGIRGPAEAAGATYVPLSSAELRSGRPATRLVDLGAHSLLAVPGLCNMTGARVFTPRDVALWRRRHPRCSVFLDAAALAGSAPLRLGDWAVDFACVSLYKICGMPTGVGALFVRKGAQGMLRRRYFGGGTVEVAMTSVAEEVMRRPVEERLEAGTLPFVEAACARDALAFVAGMGGMETVARHTSAVTAYALERLTAMRHLDGVTPVITVYNGGCAPEPAGQATVKTTSSTTLSSTSSLLSHSITGSDAGAALETPPSTASATTTGSGVVGRSLDQGPIIAFNVTGSDGEPVGYSVVGTLAAMEQIHIRVGCFCNPGACRESLGQSDADARAFHAEGHVCGDARDIIDGRHTGACRVSFGFYSTLGDVDALVDFLHRSFVAIDTGGGDAGENVSDGDGASAVDSQQRLAPRAETSPSDAGRPAMVGRDLSTATIGQHGDDPDIVSALAGAHAAGHGSEPDREPGRSPGDLPPWPLSPVEPRDRIKGKGNPHGDRDGGDDDDDDNDDDDYEDNNDDPTVHANRGATLNSRSATPLHTPTTTNNMHDTSGSGDVETSTGNAPAVGSGPWLEEIRLYPLKGARALVVHEWPVGPRGLVYDREWTAVDADTGAPLSLKTAPRLAQIKPVISLRSGTLMLSHCPPRGEEKRPSLVLPLRSEDDPNSRMIPESRRERGSRSSDDGYDEGSGLSSEEFLGPSETALVTICGTTCSAVPCGERADLWLSSIVGRRCRLLRKAEPMDRPECGSIGGANAKKKLSLPMDSPSRPALGSTPAKAFPQAGGTPGGSSSSSTSTTTRLQSPLSRTSSSSSTLSTPAALTPTANASVTTPGNKKSKDAPPASAFGAVVATATSSASSSSLISMSSPAALPSPRDPVHPIPARLRPSPAQVGFANRAQFLVVTRESLADLSSRVSSAQNGKNCDGNNDASNGSGMMVGDETDPASADRFRANLIIRCGWPGAAYDEDTWTSIVLSESNGAGGCADQAGPDSAGVRLRACGPCTRCAVVNADPLGRDVTPSSEPLRTLFGYRREPGTRNVGFGVYFSCSSLGELGVISAGPVRIERSSGGTVGDQPDHSASKSLNNSDSRDLTLSSEEEEDDGDGDGVDADDDGGDDDGDENHGAQE